MCKYGALSIGCGEHSYECSFVNPALVHALCSNVVDDAVITGH